MKRILSVFCILVLATAAAGQPAVREIKMTVLPAGEPIPSLKYQLLPDLADQTPGNGAQLYYLAFIEMEGYEKVKEKVEGWLKMPPKDLPGNEVQEVMAKFSAALRQVELAAHCERCEWNLPIRSEGLHLRIPPLSRFRDLARLLAVKARVEIAAGNFDQAVRTLQIGFAMARDLGQGPTLIHGLVGVAIASMMVGQTKELIQAPGAPNLYWALTLLPRTIIDLRRGIRYEMGSVYFAFPGLRDLMKGGQLTKEQWGSVLKGIGEVAGGENHHAGLGIAAAIAMRTYPAAKRAMIAKGHTPEEVDKMPVAHVVATHALDAYLRLRDESFKWHFVPYWQAHEAYRRQGQTIDAGSQLEGYPLTMLLPALGRASLLRAKLERRIAALRCIEAVRMYAAAHKGKLPASLGDVTDAPVPINPVTGTPFGYKAEGNTFTLDAAAMPDCDPKDSTRFVVTLTN